MKRSLFFNVWPSKCKFCAVAGALYQGAGPAVPPHFYFRALEDYTMFRKKQQVFIFFFYLAKQSLILNNVKM
jgi:hypothetical protein